MTQTQTQSDNAVIQSLQQQLANSFLLYANYKKYHWESFGPLFRDLHLLFDEHATAVLNTIDELGERIRILGAIPTADLRQYGEIGTVKIAEGKQTMKAMVGEAVANHRLVIGEHRDAIGVATDGNDPGTADLFTRNIQIHEKQEWFLRQVLEQQDGF